MKSQRIALFVLRSAFFQLQAFSKENKDIGTGGNILDHQCTQFVPHEIHNLHPKTKWVACTHANLQNCSYTSFLLEAFLMSFF